MNELVSKISEHFSNDSNRKINWEKLVYQDQVGQGNFAFVIISFIDI